MLKKKILFKKYKLNQLQKIKQTFKYIYFFRYNDLNIKELIYLKKYMKKLNYKILLLNQKLTLQIFNTLQNQSPILIIYGNNNINLIKNLMNFKKLNLMYLIIQNNIYSYLKIKQIIINKNYFPFNNLIIQPFLNFIYYLRKISKAIIT